MKATTYGPVLSMTETEVSGYCGNAILAGDEPDARSWVLDHLVTNDHSDERGQYTPASVRWFEATRTSIAATFEADPLIDECHGSSIDRLSGVDAFR